MKQRNLGRKGCETMHQKFQVGCQGADQPGRVFLPILRGVYLASRAPVCGPRGPE